MERQSPPVVTFRYQIKEKKFTLGPQHTHTHTKKILITIMYCGLSLPVRLYKVQLINTRETITSN